MLFYRKVLLLLMKKVLLVFITFNNDGKNIAPTLLVSVIVNEHLHVKVFVSSVFIPQTKYGYLITLEKIQFIFEISNILAWCKAHAELSTSTLNNHQNLLNLIFVLLKSYISPYMQTKSLIKSKLIVIATFYS